ncbi:helix-turn-helix domain-containing protein [Methyloligella solikamskensis]|uniref:Helix-turn-helix domain-containing protein n=1 Tax=Methyloligella solikamskensis TaxID=1177756 RepID=A0ABW3JBW1_9HYPH
MTDSAERFAETGVVEVFPSIKRLAGMTDVDRRTAQRALRTLEEAGVIETLRSEGGSETNRYRLMMDDATSRGGSHAAPGGRQSGSEGGGNLGPIGAAALPPESPTNRGYESARARGGAGLRSATTVAGIRGTST